MRILWIILSLFAVACSSTNAEDDRLRVLYIGNSLTATNDLPGIVAAFAEASRLPMRYEALTPPGWSLSDHWLVGDARQVLADGDFDVVVLQQGPSAEPESQDHLKRWAREWSAFAREHGAEPALLMVWPSDARRGDFPAVVESYSAAAEGAGAELLPAGKAWLVAWEAQPTVPLYGADGFHPSESGSYLAALVAYGSIMNTGLADLPTEIELASGTIAVPADRAARLKEAASAALAGSAAP